MNYVCAAGTGSFIEEQALQAGHLARPSTRTRDGQARAAHVGPLHGVHGARPRPADGQGLEPKDRIAAAVLHSVRDNYLNKVVGGLHIGEHIYFQGATARNKALVAAFEQSRLQRPIAVSPYCHLTGALGMALLARERVPEADRSARFKGLAFADEKVAVETEECDLCHNLCNLSIIRSGAGRRGLGPEVRARVRREAHARRGNSPRPRSGGERAAAWPRTRRPPCGRRPPRSAADRAPAEPGHVRILPFWRTFLRELGGDVVSLLAVRPKRSCVGAARARHRGVLRAGGHEPTAHARALARTPAWTYAFCAAHARASPCRKGFTDAHFCCYVQATRGVAKSIEGLNLGRDACWPRWWIWGGRREQARRSLWRVGRANRSRPSRARCAGRCEAARAAADQAFRDEMRRPGREEIDRNRARGRAWASSASGGPYNATDPGMNLGPPPQDRREGLRGLPRTRCPSGPEDPVRRLATCTGLRPADPGRRRVRRGAARGSSPSFFTYVHVRARQLSS